MVSRGFGREVQLTFHWFLVGPTVQLGAPCSFVSLTGGGGGNMNFASLLYIHDI